MSGNIPIQLDDGRNDKATHHERALDQLGALDHMKAFGSRSTQLFQELESLRKQQISLALVHLGTEGFPAEGLSVNVDQDEDPTRRYKRNAERFGQKEAGVNNLMQQ
ncbi:hypothetical protein HK102_010596, partial [Quaeritorhiza haematococci]